MDKIQQDEWLHYALMNFRWIVGTVDYFVPPSTKNGDSGRWIVRKGEGFGLAKTEGYKKMIFFIDGFCPLCLSGKNVTIAPQSRDDYFLDFPSDGDKILIIDWTNQNREGSRVNTWTTVNELARAKGMLDRHAHDPCHRVLKRGEDTFQVTWEGNNYLAFLDWTTEHAHELLAPPNGHWYELQIQEGRRWRPLEEEELPLFMQ